MIGPDTLEPRMNRLQRSSLLVGAAAVLALLAGALFDSRQFFQSYLLAYLFWFGIALGCTAVLMLHHLVGGGWGIIIRRLLESGMRTLPLMALLVLPLLFGLPSLYLWARPEAVAADELLQHKSAYLNVPFFVGRTVFYFAVWLLMSHFLYKWSGEHDRSDDPATARRLRALSAPGLLVYGLTVTFASIDWVMSLDPHWFSTVYGMLFMVGQVLTTFAFIIAAAMMLAEQPPLAEVISKARLQDLGNLMLAFVMLWAYISFSQFLIIWSGNLPEEIGYYMHRLHGGWMWVGLILIVFHFALPFLLLLSRDVKRRARSLRRVAIAIIIVRFVDLFWMIGPSHDATHFSLHWMDLAAPVGMGGLWIAVFVWQLKGRPLVPAYHPELSAEE